MPDRYRVDRFTGSAIAAHLLGDTTSPQLAGNIAPLPLLGAGPGQIVGRITDSSGAVIPGATVIATVQGQRREARSLADGSYAIYGLPAGPMTVSSQIQGFKTTQRTLVYDERPRQIDFQLEVGGVTETVTISGDAPVIDKQSEEANRPRLFAGVAGGRGGGTGNARGEDRQQAQERRRRRSTSRTCSAAPRACCRCASTSRAPARPTASSSRSSSTRRRSYVRYRRK